MRHPYPECSIGRKWQPAGYRFTTESYELLQVIAVLEGTVFFSAAARATPANSGKLLLLRPGSAFTLWTERAEYRGICFMVNGAPALDFSGPSQVIKGNAATRVLSSLIEREISRPGEFSKPLLSALGWSLAWNCIRASSEQGAKSNGLAPDSGVVESARHALEMSAFSGKSPREALRSFEISYRQISRYFKRELQIAPKQYQLRFRIQEASRLLSSTDMSITSIAYELGFSSSQHLSSQFSALLKQTPQQFRRTKRS